MAKVTVTIPNKVRHSRLFSSEIQAITQKIYGPDARICGNSPLLNGSYHGRVPLVRSFFLLLFLAGCTFGPPKPPLVKSVAILLFDNESNNVDAGDIMQRYVYLAMKPSAYEVMNIKETNAKLNEAGIQDGGQLAAIDLVKLGRDMGVQGLLIGNVESFSYTNIGIYVSRKVRLALKLVNATTGETMWENAKTAANRKFGLDKDQIRDNFVQGLADQWLDKIFSIPLAAEAKLATRHTLQTLPGFRFKGFYQDKKYRNDQKKRVGKRIIKGALEGQ